MTNQLYLAMTAAEFFTCEKIPQHMAWMACHFSPYGAGLSNIPKELPPGSILIINDRIEPAGHDPELVAKQALEVVEKLHCSGVLLDLQRPGSSLTQQIAKTVTLALPCSVAVSYHYAKDLPCGVFLPPPPMRKPLKEHIVPWEGKEIWMEVYEQWETVTVGKDAVKICHEAPAELQDLPCFSETFCCRYTNQVYDDRAVFTLHRGWEELCALSFPVSRFVGLWQEYRRSK